MTIRGTIHDDDLDGTTGDDIFLLARGGSDTAHGDDGNDIFRMGGALNTGDRIDGGADFDEIRLDGDYAEGIMFAADTITNIERIRLAAGHDYRLTMNDGNVAAKATLIVNAGPLGVGDKFTFDGSAETDGHFTLYGGHGDDSMTGGALGDIIDIDRGGSDTVHGGGGDDHFYLNGAFDATDVVDGGSGSDTAVLLGDYGIFDGLVPFNITAGMLQNVETLLLRDGHYILKLQDGVVASGETLTVDGSHVHISDLRVDASLESDGHYAFIGGTRNDLLTGGAQSDNFDLTRGGLDTVHGGNGDDTITLGAQFDSDSNFNTGDHIDGGAGFDTVTLDGPYFLTLLSNSFASVEKLVLTGNHLYYFISNDGIVFPSANMEIDGSALTAQGQLSFFGTSETDGTYTLIGGAGGDELHGGAGNDTFQGGLERDNLTGNGGSDTFIYTQVADSTGIVRDQILDIDFSLDRIQTDLSVPLAIDALVTGDISGAFNSGLEANIGAAQLGAHDAVLFTDTGGGDFGGRTFLIIDHNGVAGYQANQDYVIEVTGYSGTLDTTSFITGP